MTKIVGTNINDTLLGGAENDLIFGLAGDDSLTGGEGGDRLDGGIGADKLSGGDGNDIYVVDNALDSVVETGVADFADEVRTALSTVTAFAGIEKFTFTGSKAVTFSGNDEDNIVTGTGANDTLSGLAGGDTLNGGKGADSLAGGADDDFYIVDNAKDIVDENGADGIDRVVSALSFSLAENGTTVLGTLEDLELTGKANLTGTGNEAQNEIIGNAGNNKLDGAGNDDFLAGGNGNDTLLGGVDNDILIGGAGNDSLDGGSGVDAMEGGEGSDVYNVDVATDQANDSGTTGTDTVIASVSFIISAGVENLILTGAAGKSFGLGNDLGNRITGNSADNTLDGGEGVDTLDGGAGDDSLQGDIGDNGKDLLIGGEGNDIFIVGSNDIILEGAKGGTDTVVYVGGLGTYTLGANLENLFLDDTTPTQSGIGNGLDNQIFGTNGDDTLDGRGGADTLRGNGGDDTYGIDNAKDQVIEFGGEGTDEVRSTVALTGTYANVENYIFLTNKAVIFAGDGAGNRIIAGNGNDSLSGNDGDDSLLGGGGNDTLAGGFDNDLLQGQLGNDGLDGGANDDTLVGDAGNDTLFGDTEADLLIGDIGNDSLDGGIHSDTLLGGAGNDLLKGGVGNFKDTLDGGAGADTMDGGEGDDTYDVDNIGDKASEIYDDAGGGTFDIVLSTVTHTLGFGIEFLTLQGTAKIDGAGNDLDNVISGNAGANKVSGLGGKDVLEGNDGNDTLDGGSGGDKMDGGLGNDTFVVDNRTDLVGEGFNGGADTILSSVEFDLTTAIDVENLTLTGTGDTYAYGNDLDNRLIGNSGNNLLFEDGTLGKDTIDGGAGNDILIAGAGNDSLLGGDGIDTLLGGDDADTLDGGNGNDTLVGGGGDDTIIVSKGNDMAVYQSTLDGHDLITGFDGNAAGGQDLLDLETLFNNLSVGVGDRAARVQITDKGTTVEVRVDTDGDLTFDLFVATIQTPDAVTVGQDVLVGS